MANVGEGPAQTDPQHSEMSGAKARRSLARGLITLGLLILLIVGLLLAVPGLDGVGDAVARMNVSWLLAGVVLEIFSCVGYVLAFLQVFDRAPISFGARVALSELAFGAAVSVGGAGSLAVGGWLLVDRGAPAGRVVERSAVLFLLTSGVNLITLALAGLGLWVGILPGPRNPLLSLLPGAVGVLVFAVFLALPWLMGRLAGDRPPGKIRALLAGTAESIIDARRLLFHPDWRLIGAFAFLWCDIGVLVVCFAALGHVPPLATIVLAYQIGYLSNLIPVPGGIGVLDGSVVGLFVLYGVNATTATAATLVYHAISLWIPAMWGVIAFLLLSRSRGQPLTLRVPRVERLRLRHWERSQRRVAQAHEYEQRRERTGA